MNSSMSMEDCSNSSFWHSTETADCYPHKLLSIMNRSATSVLEEFLQGEGAGTELLACQTTLKFIAQNHRMVGVGRDLKSYKEWRKEVFIHSHTQEHCTGLTPDRSVTKGSIR